MSFSPVSGPLRAWAERRGIRIGARRISPGDAALLWPDEAAILSGKRPDALRASGAARALARELLAGLGAPPRGILRDAAGVPLWPQGFVGSLAHDASHALAAVAACKHARAIGVDIEPDGILTPEMTELVATRAERARYDEALLRSPVLFVIKEAVFKALFPQDRRFLEFHDIEVDLEAGRARARVSEPCAFALERGAKICALAAREP